MFDKLVESNASDADLKPRRKFFFVSSVVVGILFATAVIASIYAADFDLGTDNFDIAELMTPIAESEPPVEEPEPVQNQRRNDQPSNDIVRQVIMAPTTDYTRVPDKVSTDINPYRSIDTSKFTDIRIGKYDSDPAGYSDASNLPSGTGSSGKPVADDPDTGEAPPAPKVERSKAPVSGGVMTGKATSLPQPAYSAAARAVGAQGAVTVQITVDEGGKVISARALDGHPLLRPSAVAAAWKAKFGPTTLTGVAVKVTGIITYNFKK